MKKSYLEIITQMQSWLDEAQESISKLPPQKALMPHNAMSLSTVTKDNRPSVRIVLLKSLDERGITFFTNFESQKGQDLLVHPHASGLFYWPTLARQLRFMGPVTKVDRQESQNYWKSRPLASQVSGTISPQGQVIPNYQWLIDESQKLRTKSQGLPLPCPSFWGGYLITLEEVEFWENDPNRLHKRLLYKKDQGDSSSWSEYSIAP